MCLCFGIVKRKKLIRKDENPWPRCARWPRVIHPMGEELRSAICASFRQKAAFESVPSLFTEDSLRKIVDTSVFLWDILCAGQQPQEGDMGRHINRITGAVMALKRHKAKVVVRDDYADMCEAAADFITARIENNRNIVLGLATGGTMENVYACLVKKYNAGSQDFSGVKSFNLDEYAGLPKNHRCSYLYFMNENLFKRVNIKKNSTHVPIPATAKNPRACEKYEKKIRRSGGIGLQLLGIGRNGHIAFNEPGSGFDSRTRMVELSKSTLRANAVYFKGVRKMPHRAVSMGIGTILEAKEILILASGRKKSAAVAAAIKGPVTEKVPASALQMHPRVTFILDREAASLL